MSRRQELEQAIEALEAQRSVLGDEVVDVALGPMREKLATLQAEERPQRQRKQVTVLFADVVGFTAMSETMDAEEVTEIMNRLWQRLDAVISEHGGFIDKHIGDAVMAIWGAETAQEDDPQQAVRAALTMQQELAALDRAGGESGRLVSMRIGISTGTVLLGEVGSAHEYTAMGDPVNVASRLQHFCPEGSVVVSHDTFRHVRGLFDVRTLEPVSLKGKAEPVRAYLVERARARAFRVPARGVEGVETRMIGRDSELKRLQDTFYETNQDRTIAAVTIVGEPGIGKSRLLYEFENWVDLQPLTVQLFRGRARHETRHVPYGIWRELFALEFDIHDNDSLPQVREKLIAGFQEKMLAQEQLSMRVDVLGRWFGYDIAEGAQDQNLTGDPRHLQDRGVTYLADYFKAVSANKLVVFLIEDFHWSDDSSLDVLIRLCRSLHDSALLVVGTARPILYEKRPNWFEGRTYHTKLPLKPLSKSDARLLVEEILRRVHNLPEALRELIAGNSEGNPFYAEELIKMMVEQGVFTSGSDEWTVHPERLDTASVPPTLTGVLQARLDSLPAQERTVIQQASVVGRVFWDKALAHINQAIPEGLDQSDIPSALTALRKRELVYHHDSSLFEEANEYTFKHALLRDVTYESVLKADRRRYHGQVAAWLVEYAPERVDKISGLAADHFWYAGEVEKALTYFIQAGQEATKNFANREAVDYFTRALDLLDDDDVNGQWRLLLVREELQILLGDSAEAAVDLQSLAGLVDREDNAQWRAVLKVRQAAHLEVIGEYPAAIKMAEEAVKLAQEAGLPGQVAEAHLILGRVHWSLGEFHTSVIHQAQALDLYRELGDRRAEAEALLEYGGAVWTDGDSVAGVDYTAQALEVARETGNRVIEGTALNNLGYAAWAYGDYAQAERYIEAALAVYRELGAGRHLAASLTMLGRAALAQKDYARALKLSEEATRRDKETDNLGSIGISLAGMADSFAGLDLLEEAEQAYRQAINYSEEYGRVERAMRARAGWARMALGQGDDARALQLVDEIMRWLGDGNRLYGSIEPLSTLAVCILVFQATNDPRADGLLEETYASIMALADKMPDASARRMFLENVPWHREIVALWQARDGTGQK